MLELLLAAALAGSAVPTFIPHPCTGEALAARARCGTVEVPEDRSGHGDRRISLNLLIIPAATGGKERLALFDLQGGPGLPATLGASFYFGDGAAYRARHDIVLLDQRGTGASHPLDCPELDAPAARDGPMFPLPR